MRGKRFYFKINQNDHFETYQRVLAQGVPDIYHATILLYRHLKKYTNIWLTICVLMIFTLHQNANIQSQFVS
jgi:hypothetical protein